MDDLTIILFVGLVALIIGIAIGYLLSAERSSKPAPGDLQAAEAPKPGLRSLIRLWIDETSRSVVPEIGEHLYFSPEGLDHKAREQLAHSLEQIQSWLAAAPPAGKPAGERSPALEADLVASTADQDLEASGAAELPKDKQTAAQPAGLNPASLLARALQTEVHKPTRVLSIVEQIDEVLQEQLEDSPLASRGIRLQESPSHSLVVQVGLKRYESIDDVPDLEVRNLIRAAVAEWEKRASGA